MEASKKANELANKFISKSVFDMTDEDVKEQREQGKAFAIICVDEIEKAIDSLQYERKTDYWQEVKKEIGKQ